MSDGFKRVKTIFNAEPGKTAFDIPKKPKKQFVSALGRGSKILTDTVKQGSEIAKKSIDASARGVKKASSQLNIPKVKFRKDPKDDDLEEKIDKLFNGQDLLFERLDSEPKLSLAMRKSLATIKTSSKTAAHYVRRQPVVAKVLIIVGISLLSGGYSFISSRASSTPNQSNQISEVAGVSTSEDDSQVNTDKKTTKPSFKVLTPSGKEIEGVEREAPSGDKLYSYADDIAGVGTTVTQQPLPDSFLKESDSKLASLAKANYFASVIQIDNITVYHGTNEKTNQQSAVLIKGKNLVFIEISQKVSDESLTAYILSLQ